MVARRLFRLILWPVGALLLANASHAAPPALDPGPAVQGSKVHVIYAALTDDETIGDFVEINVFAFDSLITNQLAADRLGSFQRLHGSLCTAETILATLDSLRVEPADTLLLYYAGHGAHDPNAPDDDSSKGQYFALPDRVLARRELMERMSSKRPRLLVLLSDCCDVEGAIKVKQRIVYEVKTVTVKAFTGLEELLLAHRGIVDANACSRDEYSWYSEDVGGWFTHTFVGEINLLRHQQPHDWNVVWPDLAEAMEAFFQEQKEKFAGENDDLDNQPHMRPAAYKLEVTREEPADVPQTSREIMVTVGSLVPAEAD